MHWKLYSFAEALVNSLACKLNVNIFNYQHVLCICSYVRLGFLKNLLKMFGSLRPVYSGRCVWNARLCLHLFLLLSTAMDSSRDPRGDTSIFLVCNCLLSAAGWTNAFVISFPDMTRLFISFAHLLPASNLRVEWHNSCCFYFYRQ